MKRDAIDQILDQIHQLRVDFERFFNGALLIPPVELADRIKAELRALRTKPGSSLVENFRLSQVESRFNTYSELFNRRLREREEGRGSRVAPGEAAPLHDPRAGIVVGGDLSTAEVEALYQGFSGGAQQVRFDLDSFRTYLSRQLTAIRTKTGAARVRFRLVEEGGKTKLKAMPVKGA